MDEVLKRDQNRVTVLAGVTDDSNQYITMLRVNSSSKRLLVSATGSGQGSVTDVSVVTANGFAGTVANSTTTPAITLSTTITGILKGNGTAISAASDGTDYLSPTTGITVDQTVGQTLGTTGARLTKAWMTDLTVTNAISGSITGNAATVTTNANLTGVITSVGNVTSIASQTGTGTKFVVDTSPTLVTPNLGVATATSINKVAITAPATSATLTIADGKTLTASNTLTLAGTDSTTMTFPSTNATIARTDAAQTFTGTQTFSQVNLTANAITASGNAATVPITSGRNIVTNNSAATLTITLTTTSAVNMQTCIVQILDASAVAQTITWVNTEDSTVTAPTTSNGSTTLPLTVGFIYNSATSKWRCVAKA